MKTLIFIHGRSWKPEKDDLEQLWLDAIEHGIKRDCPDKLQAFQKVNKTFVYYGDISNKFLFAKTGKKPPVADVKSRKKTLKKLKTYNANQFNKRTYKKLPGMASLKEAAADILSPILNFLRLGDNVISQVAPDVGEYWKGEDSYFGSAVRESLTPHLEKAFIDSSEVCLIAHSLGSMIAYDTLWKFSYRGEYRHKYINNKIDRFITLGSPLGDATVQKGLLGAKASGQRKYPTNIRDWFNFAAEDDFISHDSKIKNDFKDMIRYKMLRSINDEHVYNLAVRGENSNPHHSTGYLIHPKVIKAIVEWV